MPPLPSKRTLEEDSEDEYDDNENDNDQPVIKRQRESSSREVSLGDISSVEHSSRGNSPEQEIPTETRISREDVPRDEGSGPDNQRGDTRASLVSADAIVDLLVPRLEAKMQQMVNGVAVRMLQSLGTRLNKLEARMEQMQHEWRRAIDVEDDDVDHATKQPPTARQQYALNQHQSAQKHHLITPDDSETRTVHVQTRVQPDPLHNFLQEAARIADSPEVAQPSSVRKGSSTSKPHPAPELLRVIYNAHPSAPSSDTPHDQVSQHHLDRRITTVTELWHEFFVGTPERPAINELDQKYGNAWRWKNPKETTYYGLRRVIIDELNSRVESRCPNATCATGDVWLAVCEEMDNERTALKASLNQYIQELKRRKRLVSPPTPVPVTVDPNEPPPEPVMSRTTATVAELWVEWFEGKSDYNGHERFPSVIELNQRWGDTWRKTKSAEYGFYLRRRCIIDIALRRMLTLNGDWDEAKVKVLREMDAERGKEGFSLNQYAASLRLRYSYHGSLRTQIPKEIIEMGAKPEEFREEFRTTNMLVKSLETSDGQQQEGAPDEEGEADVG